MNHLFRKDGTRTQVIVAGATIDDDRTSGVAFVLDITDRKRAEAALRELNQTLEGRVAQRTAESSPPILHEGRLGPAPHHTGGAGRSGHRVVASRGR